MTPTPPIKPLIIVDAEYLTTQQRYDRSAKGKERSLRYRAAKKEAKK